MGSITKMIRQVSGHFPRKTARFGMIVSLSCLFVAGGCQSTDRQDVAKSTDSPATPDAAMVGFLETHCYVCHGVKRQKGGIDIESAMATHGRIADADLLGRIIKVVSNGEMPPSRRPQPEQAEVLAFVERLHAEQEAQLASIEPDPGRVTVRRLNRSEYNNTVRDLLGVESRPADTLPPDDTGYGFDNIGDVLTLSPLLAEKYLDIAEEVAAEAMEKELAAFETTRPSERHVLVCDHADPEHERACAERAIRHLAPRAYRRPATRDEIKKLEGFYQLAIDHSEGVAGGLELAIQAMLVSPHFLFRAEEGPAPTDPDVHYDIADYHFASRLSYFLWSSMPDPELMETVRDGSLHNPRTLRNQVRRMLRDPRSKALAENFGGQWLQFRNLQVVDPDPDLYPEFTDELRVAMAGETTHFFAEIVAEDRSILDFVDADYTYVNEPLAAHYGIDGIAGPEFQRIPVDKARRGGLLGQASVLTVTSMPTRTSPVLRGLWVLENLLASHPPPPPPDVPALEAADIDPNATMREKLNKHREDASCASCHDRIDPLGFGLENYNAIGKWRTEDQGKPVDSSGVLPDGTSFDGPAALKEVLMERKDDFVRCLAEKMLTYALGRGLEDYDEPALNEIVENVSRRDYRFSELVYEVVRSLPFTEQRGEAESS